MLKTIRERRAALKASLEALNAAAVTEAGEARSLTATEASTFAEGMTELREIDGRISDLQEAEVREAAAAAHHVATPAGPEARDRVVKVDEPNPVYRRDNSQVSYFKDLYAAQVSGMGEARERLVRSQESRALTTVAGAGGQFAPPLWLTEDFVALARAGRVTADLMQHDTLPEGVSSINLPTVSTGTSQAVVVTQNTAISNTDIATSSVTSGITTIAGQQVVSLQLLQQSGIPFDRVILGDLARAYATQIDLQVISGSGASGQLRGLLNGSGVGATTFTTASPALTSATAANSFYNKIAAAIASVHTNRFLAPTVIVMHPNRWAWVLEALDSTTRPIVTPLAYAQFNSAGSAVEAPHAEGQVGSLLGLPVFVDPNIPTNLGAGTNEDRVFVMRADDCWLYESAVQTASFDATYAAQNSILFRVLGYSAFIPDRYGKSVNVIAGTGLIAPTL